MRTCKQCKQYGTCIYRFLVTGKIITIQSCIGWRKETNIIKLICNYILEKIKLHEGKV